MTEILRMGGYAVFVWSSVAFALAVFAWNVVSPALQRRALLDRLAAEQEERNP